MRQRCPVGRDRKQCEVEDDLGSFRDGHQRAAGDVPVLQAYDDLYGQHDDEPDDRFGQVCPGEVALERESRGIADDLAVFDPEQRPCSGKIRAILGGDVLVLEIVDPGDAGTAEAARPASTMARLRTTN